MDKRYQIEKKWAQEKYKVMLHSQKHYDLIRKEMKSDLSEEALDTLLEEAFNTTPTKGSIENAFNHMWGYFKKICTEEEREEASALKEAFPDQQTGQEELLRFISALADKYEVTYLQNSSVLK